MPHLAHYVWHRIVCWIGHLLAKFGPKYIPKTGVNSSGLSRGGALLVGQPLPTLTCVSNGSSVTHNSCCPSFFHPTLLPESPFEGRRRGRERCCLVWDSVWLLLLLLPKKDSTPPLLFPPLSFTHKGFPFMEVRYIERWAPSPPLPPHKWLEFNNAAALLVGWVLWWWIIEGFFWMAAAGGGGTADTPAAAAGGSIKM